MNYIAFDVHKRYTLASVERAKECILREVKVGHERGAIRQFFLTCDPGSPVAAARRRGHSTLSWGKELIVIYMGF